VPFSVIGFVIHNDALHAVTSFAGTITDACGRPGVGTFEGILIPVRVRRSTPRVLKLEFEHLPLELLGKQTEPGRTTLEITDRSGPGLLRADLLPAIAHACDDPSTTSDQLVRLLNRLLVPVA
jgi:hypothetical protein